MIQFISSILLIFAAGFLLTLFAIIHLEKDVVIYIVLPEVSAQSSYVRCVLGTAGASILCVGIETYSSSSATFAIISFLEGMAVALIVTSVLVSQRIPLSAFATHARTETRLVLLSIHHPAATVLDVASDTNYAQRIDAKTPGETFPRLVAQSNYIKPRCGYDLLALLPSI